MKTPSTKGEDRNVKRYRSGLFTQHRLSNAPDELKRKLQLFSGGGIVENLAAALSSIKNYTNRGKVPILQ